MKFRMTVLLLLLSMLLSACGGNYAQVDLQEPVAIPGDGVISENIVRQLRKEAAIGIFQGQSGDFFYEWTIFGSDITEASAINLQVDIQDLGADGIKLQFAQEQPFGFPALLSVHLNDLWDAQTATGWQGSAAVCSVSLTGSADTILNLSVRDTLGTCIIRPDAKIEETIPVAIQSSTEAPAQTEAQEEYDYLSPVKKSSGRVYSDGGGSGLDQYQTGPVPAGKPMPVEPENQTVNSERTYSCTFSIECSTILNNLDMLDSDKLEMVPSNGVILATTTVSFYEGESVFDVLQRLCRNNGIHMEAEWTPIYNSAYVQGIHNLYEFDCGSLSGWMYRVNGWYPNYGSSRYQLREGDVVEWRYTCDLGQDVGGAYAVQG